MTSPPPPAEILRGMQDLRIAFEAVTERVAKAAGLNPRDLGVLDILHADGPATPKELTARTGIHPATLTAALARLERGGHTSRRTDPDDRRSARIAITDTTVRLLEQQYESVDNELGSWFGEMSASDRILIAAFLHTAASKISTAGRVPRFE